MKTIIAFTLLMTAFLAHSQDDIRLGNPGYGGNGCPAGSASYVLTANQKNFKLLLDNFLVEAGGYNPKVARKSCNLAIPVHIPKGFSVAISQTQHRGFHSLTQGARANFAAEFFFAGTSGPRFARAFQGPQTSDYLIQKTLSPNALVWSHCGEDVNLRVNTAITVMANAHADDVWVTQNEFQLNVVWRRCAF